MVNKILNKDKCCGCGVCVVACPIQAIEMIIDEEGFEYPLVDMQKCIRCDKCNKVCPMENPSLYGNSIRGTFAVKNKNEAVRSRSRSGGIFTAVTDAILNMGGSIYGSVLDDNYIAKHIRANQAEQRDKMCGSKYVQSSTVRVWNEVKQDIKDGKIVLFSGTSCQIDGLRHFLGKNTDNLYCMDIVCHGVPSPKILDMYIRWREEKLNSKCKRWNFRNKTDFGWADHIETMWMENGTRVDSKVYARIFYSDYPLRPSCYACPYKNIVHPGDITIADYWNIDKACRGFNDNKGVSLVLINNDKGQKLFAIAEKSLEYRQTEIEDSLQKPLYESATRPTDRENFWKLVEQDDFDNIALNYGGLDKKEVFNEKMYLPKAKMKKYKRIFRKFVRNKIGWL